MGTVFRISRSRKHPEPFDYAQDKLPTGGAWRAFFDCVNSAHTQRARHEVEGRGFRDLLRIESQSLLILRFLLARPYPISSEFNTLGLARRMSDLLSPKC